MYKVFFITFGCKVNSCETESMQRLFEDGGYEIAADESSADIFVINSCTVTQSGDSKSLYAARRLRRSYPEAVIVLTGCLPQAAEAPEELCPEADIITGTKERKHLPSLVSAVLENRERQVFVPEYSREDKFEELPVGMPMGKGRTRGFLKIQDGCNCFCSYCLIPYARGRCRSKSIEAVRDEAEKLAETGHKEIVLVGINLAFYGFEQGLRLVDAVEECCRIPGIERVRLGSLEPEMISEEDLLRLSELPEFCPQFHLSLQSGSAATLRRMNRKYTPEEYAAIVEKIRSFFPDAAFTTDIMVGFPDETEEEFEESLAFAESIGFSKIHVFQYSPRKGTPAAKMPQIPKNIKEQRADRMKELDRKLQEKYLKSLVGKTVPVLFERESSPQYHQGHAPDHTVIKILRKNSKKSLRNSVFCVIIEESRDDHCLGTIIDQE